MRSVISAPWLGIIFVASAKVDFTRLPATSWFQLASALSSCLQICRIRSCETISSGCSCATSVVQQGYGRGEDRLFLVAVLLHSCLLPETRSLFASQHAGTAAHLLRLVDERTENWRRIHALATSFCSPGSALLVIAASSSWITSHSAAAPAVT